MNTWLEFNINICGEPRLNWIITICIFGVSIYYIVNIQQD